MIFYPSTINREMMKMEELAKKITARLDELRCMLQADGGDLEVVAIEGKVV